MPFVLNGPASQYLCPVAVHGAQLAAQLARFLFLMSRPRVLTSTQEASTNEKAISNTKEGEKKQEEDCSPDRAAEFFSCQRRTTKVRHTPRRRRLPMQRRVPRAHRRARRQGGGGGGGGGRTSSSTTLAWPRSDAMSSGVTLYSSRRLFAFAPCFSNSSAT